MIKLDVKWLKLGENDQMIKLGLGMINSRIY